MDRISIIIKSIKIMFKLKYYYKFNLAFNSSSSFGGTL